MAGKTVTVLTGSRAIPGYISVADDGFVEIRFTLAKQENIERMQEKLQNLNLLEVNLVDGA